MPAASHAELFAPLQVTTAPGLGAGVDKCSHRRMLETACLVLAGPEPSAIADDPEGSAVLRQLQAEYDALPPCLQRDVKIVLLPMHDRDANAEIVNAIQRASVVIVQNSLQEGFGLTATEAMAKRVCVVGTAQACGLRTQIRHGIDGLLTQGNAADYRNVAATINTALSSKALRDHLALNGVSSRLC